MTNICHSEPRSGEESSQTNEIQRFSRRSLATLGMTFSVVVSLSCSSATTGLTPLPAGGKHVLFVGNSLTYVNNLPGTVETLAQAAGDTVRVMTVAGPNLALIDHLNGATPVVSAIKLGGWDYVVLQQGPTPAGICRDSLVLWSKMFDSLIREFGGKPAIMMSWPASTASAAAFDAVRTSFEDAAIATNGTFLPVGEAWREALTANPALPLYSNDGFHPSPIGTYLAALEIYERISGRDVRTLDKNVVIGGVQFVVPDSIVIQLQNAAHLANQKYPASVLREITPPAGGPPVGSC